MIFWPGLRILCRSFSGLYVAVTLPLIFGFRHSSKVGKHFANCRPCGSALQHETHINFSKDKKLWLKSKHHCSGWRKQAKHIFICLFDNNLYNRIFQSQSNPELKGQTLVRRIERKKLGRKQILHILIASREDKLVLVTELIM